MAELLEEGLDSDEEDLPILEPLFEECTELDNKLFEESLPQRKQQMEELARSEALDMQDEELLKSLSPEAKANSAESKEIKKEVSPNKRPPATQSEITMYEREVIIAENFVEDSEGGCLLFTFWEYAPEEAREETGADSNEVTIASDQKQHHFLCSSDYFTLQIGLNPVYQEVLIARESFSEELGAALLLRGWVRRTVDVDDADPYIRFKDWSFVWPRLKKIRSYHAGESSEETLTSGAKDNGGEKARRWLLEKNLSRLESIGMLDEVGCEQEYRVLTRRGLCPLRKGEGRFPKRDTDEEPLKKRARMRWMILNGKVVKKKRKGSQKILSTNPGLSPVQEVLSSSSLCSVRSRIPSRKSLIPMEIPQVVVVEFDADYSLSPRTSPSKQTSSVGVDGLSSENGSCGVLCESTANADSGDEKLSKETTEHVYDDVSREEEFEDEDNTLYSKVPSSDLPDAGDDDDDVMYCEVRRQTHIDDNLYSQVTHHPCSVQFADTADDPDRTLTEDRSGEFSQEMEDEEWDDVGEYV